MKSRLGFLNNGCIVFEWFKPQRLSEAGAPRPGLDWLIPELGLEMRWIPAGSFVRGSSIDEQSRFLPRKGAAEFSFSQPGGVSGPGEEMWSALAGVPMNLDNSDESPAINVAISTGFWIGVNPVTQEEFRSVAGYNPSELHNTSQFRLEGKRHPLVQVTWTEAVAFCKKLIRKERRRGRVPEGFEFRLPTEAEWEYSCRAGTQTAFSFGNDLSSLEANFYDQEAVEQREYSTIPVGSFPPNQFGLRDMHGNVFEWCLDWYARYSEGDVVDPIGPKTGRFKVIRGGSALHKKRDCRSAARRKLSPWGHSTGFLGFRLALGRKLAVRG